jgi:hypothetical protein
MEVIFGYRNDISGSSGRGLPVQRKQCRGEFGQRSRDGWDDVMDVVMTTSSLATFE